MTYPTLINSTDRQILAEYLTKQGIRTAPNAGNDQLCTNVFKLKRKKPPENVEERCKAVRFFVEKLKEDRHKQILVNRYAPKFRPLKQSKEMARTVERASETRKYGSKDYE